MTNDELLKQAMAKTTDDLLKQVLAKAHAEGQQLLEKEQEKVRTDRKSIVSSWKEARKRREKEEHEARVKSGTEIAESFVQEVADAFLRMTSDPDNAKLLSSLRITFIPGKSDSAGPSTAAIYDGSKRIQTFYRASLDNLRKREAREAAKLKEETSFNGTTTIEMLEEIQRLQTKLENRSRATQDMAPIVAAAQQLLLARAEDKDLKESLHNLEQQFLPPSKRTPLSASPESN